MTVSTNIWARRQRHARLSPHSRRGAGGGAEFLRYTVCMLIEYLHVSIRVNYEIEYQVPLAVGRLLRFQR